MQIINSKSNILLFALWLLMLVFLAGCSDEENENKTLASPDYSGMTYAYTEGSSSISESILTSSDTTCFVDTTYKGIANKSVYDRGVDSTISINAFVFEATYDDGLAVDIIVNPNIGSQSNAETNATLYATELGRLPRVLREDVKRLVLHNGVGAFGGGDDEILIYTQTGDYYISSNILGEILIHEATHTSLDNPHATSIDWYNAQINDGVFISLYSHDNPIREDVAESFLIYLGMRHKTNAISNDDKILIENSIHNRLEYFDSKSFNLYPW